MVEYLSKEPRVEVIIVDNCSTYRSVLILLEYDTYRMYAQVS